jgi:general secretion pathway protein I
MVAISVLAIALTIILQQFSAGLKIAYITSDYTQAVLYAKAKLEEALLERDFSEKDERGETDDGFEWRLSVAPYEDFAEEDEESYEQLPVEMYQITSVVSWAKDRKERQVELMTLKTIRREGWK